MSLYEENLTKRINGGIGDIVYKWYSYPVKNPQTAMKDKEDITAFETNQYNSCISQPLYDLQSQSQSQ